jgi:hypothetical protein
MKIDYGLNGAGQYDDTAAKYTLVTTVIKSTQDPLNPAAVALTDSLVVNDSIVVAPYGINFYRFLPNGDVSVRHNSQILKFTPKDNINFTSNTVTLRDTFVVLPFGTKRDYTYTLFDTTVSRNLGSKTQQTRYQVIDTVLFQGPKVVLPPNELLLLNMTPAQAMFARVHRAIISTATIDNRTEVNYTVVLYDYYYSPSLGYMVYQSMLTEGQNGRAQLVVPFPLP